MNGAPRCAWIRPPEGEAPAGRWWRFDEPLEQLRAGVGRELPGLFERLADAGEKGLWAVGWVGYEAATGFDSALATVVTKAPLLSGFSLFAPPRLAELPSAAGTELPQLAAELDEEVYSAAVSKILAAIGAGETYQVNFTFPLRGRYAGDSERLFRRLAPASAAPLAAYLDCGDSAIVSLSPELFFELAGEKLTMRPMKGTRLRGRFAEEDRLQAIELAGSVKERAENLMIVDMVRNDLGRIALPGTVAVEQLFALERYPTVWQMTSTVTARSRAGLAAIFSALFPCASVTGAPKARTMSWIAQLEGRPRGVYCGAIGWLAPQRRARFSVAIRTAIHDRQTETLEYGVGSGVVWDSTPAAEYAECLAKARAVCAPGEAFGLFETMLWRRRAGILWLDRHLNRLEESAVHFDLPVDRAGWLRALDVALAQAVRGQEDWQRVRLELAPSGEFSVASSPRSPMPRRWRLELAPEPVSTRDVRLFHKTTDRAVYDQALAAAVAVGADEALLWNERGELTEGTRTNLILVLEEGWITPARECGLLAGIHRQVLLERGRIREGILRPADLARARSIYLVNALRGWIPVRLGPARWPVPEAG